MYLERAKDLMERMEETLCSSDFYCEMAIRHKCEKKLEESEMFYGLINKSLEVAELLNKLAVYHVSMMKSKIKELDKNSVDFNDEENKAVDIYKALCIFELITERYLEERKGIELEINHYKTLVK